MRIVVPLIVLIVLATACGSDPETEAGAGPETGSSDGTGTVAVRLEETEGFFIEGFEIGLRLETGAGEPIVATLWSDVVAASGDGSLEAFYDTVFEQEVPAGEVVVLATVNVGIGPPPEVPDVEGDLRCRLVVDVPEDGRVTVEVGFDDPDDCLRPVEG